jgi:hypothetical protein
MSDSKGCDLGLSHLTNEQISFLADFSQIKDELEVEIALREIFISEVRELSHELPPLGVEHNLVLIYVLVDKARKDMPDDEREVIHELCDMLIVLTRHQNMVADSNRRIRMLRNEAIKLQALYVAKLV